MAAARVAATPAAGSSSICSPAPACRLAALPAWMPTRPFKIGVGH